MKAILYRRYGPPDVLEYSEIEKPVPKADEVLIRIHAASVNPADWHFMRGTPYLIRLFAGLRKPKSTRLGVDVAGRVEAVGVNVTRFKEGDEVFGACRGAFAEYVCTSESAVVAKPRNLTFEQAASVPIAAFTALQSLRDKGHVQAGQRVLINGASGGVGTFAVQIAKSLGADVTGVCSTRNVEMVRSIGADRVIDYTRDDFTQGTQRYDLILDCAGNHSLPELRRALNRTGTCVIVGGPIGNWIGPVIDVLKVLAYSRFIRQNFVVILAKLSHDDLIVLRDFLEEGKITPVIDRRYNLSETPEAIRYLEQGHAQGKVVISAG